MTNRSDNFNRADTTNAIGTPSDGGSAWVQLSGTWGIASNQAYESASTANCICVLETSESNGAVAMTLSAIGSLFPGLAARAADASNFIFIRVQTGDSDLFKVVAGSFTALGDGGGYANGDVLELSFDAANALTVKQNGVTQITATDAAGASNTKHGMFASQNSNGRRDDWSFTGAGGGASGPIIKRFMNGGLMSMSGGILQ